MKVIGPRSSDFRGPEAPPHLDCGVEAIMVRQGVRLRRGWVGTGRVGGTARPW
jgi:hypothetical protein